MAMAKPLVAIIGRPNVGKSTLFNRLVGRREAIVADVPGTTRDRIFADVVWDGHTFTLVDTGGLEPRPQDALREKVKAQVEAAVAEADLLVLLLDADEGLTPVDEEIGEWLRRVRKPLVLAVNKADNPKRVLASAEFYRLGLGDPIPVSAYHNLGIQELMERVVSLLPPPAPEPEAPEGVMRLSIVGRTNVGKSMLLNAILGQERAIVSEVPGTTRDALDTPFTYDGTPMVLIDTAGIRRPGRIQRGVEHYSILRAVRAMERSDVAILVMDATELATTQDIHIAGMAWESFRGLVIAVNKWDLAPEHGLDMDAALQLIRSRLRFMPYAPICFTSALLRKGIQDLLATVIDVYKERLTQVSQTQLYRAVMDALMQHPPPSEGRRRLRVYRVKQDGVNPPTFVFTVNDPQLLHFSYLRYLENQLRSALGFRHTHLKLVFKGRG
jgi:GTP-binding protein